jgi:hypothetical protein
VVSYKKGEQIGLRFDPTHHTRSDIEKWIAQPPVEAPRKEAGKRADSAAASDKA